MADNDPTPTPDPDPANPPDPTPEPERTFTQAELDRIIKDRLNRQREQFPDPDELESLKAAKERVDELEAASKSDLEKANEKIAALETAAAKSAQDAKDAALRAAVIAEAAKKNVVDPDAAYALMDRSALELDDAGSPTNIADAMDSLLEQRPYLVAQQGGARPNGADQGARTRGADQLSRDDLKKMTPSQIVEADDAGRLDAIKQGVA
jgi:hypothetical protein